MQGCHFKFGRLSRPCVQVHAWLRCKVQQVLASFREIAPSSIGGMDEASQLGYVLGFLGEYLQPHWQSALVECYNVQPIGGCLHGVSKFCVLAWLAMG